MEEMARNGGPAHCAWMASQLVMERARLADVSSKRRGADATSAWAVPRGTTAHCRGVCGRAAVACGSGAVYTVEQLRAEAPRLSRKGARQHAERHHAGPVFPRIFCWRTDSWIPAPSWLTVVLVHGGAVLRQVPYFVTYGILFAILCLVTSVRVSKVGLPRAGAGPMKPLIVICDLSRRSAEPVLHAGPGDRWSSSGASRMTMGGRAGRPSLWSSALSLLILGTFLLTYTTSLPSR